ncbi:unnamed protein product [Penicillium salamii]|uniref:Uncharacterized protein n=1 Tax=Penicillium salamii TaxID=1612424 RepID=A0A9W4N4G2_9EURO|nr:unnamed protein product [Penicillium salamii]
MFPFFILFCLLGLVQAYTTFNTNCTLPSDPPSFNYVSSPNSRGTLDIAWSCLFTIISCTWTIQHPNIPWQREHVTPGVFGWLKWKCLNYQVFVGWFLGTIIAPEYLLMKCLDDYLRAKKGLKDFAQFANEDNVEWTASHHQFARMGGFVMRTHVENCIAQYNDKYVQTEMKGNRDSGGERSQSLSSLPSPTDEERAVVNQDLSPSLVPTHKEEPQTRQKVNIKERYHPEGGWRSKGPNPFYLQPSDILMLRRERVISRLPEISEEEIQDRSKADGLMRIIAMVQIFWLCIQVITRAVAKLAVTQLEVATVAFAICAILIYILSWDKPKGVNIPTTLLNVHDSGEKAHALLANTANQRNDDSFLESHHNRMMDFTWPDLGSSAWGFGTAGIIFGSLHLAAWGFVFPTQIELTLWRVAAIYCTCVPMLVLVFILCAKFSKVSDWDHEIKEHWESPRLAEARNSLQKHLDSPNPKSLWRFFREFWRSSKWLFLLVGLVSLVYWTLIIAYIVARLYLLAEMLRTLAYQPSSAYAGTWTVNIPYVS